MKNLNFALVVICLGIMFLALLYLTFMVAMVCITLNIHLPIVIRALSLFVIFINSFALGKFVEKERKDNKQ